MLRSHNYIRQNDNRIQQVVLYKWTLRNKKTAKRPVIIYERWDQRKKILTQPDFEKFQHNHWKTEKQSTPSLQLYAPASQLKSWQEGRFPLWRPFYQRWKI